MKKSEIEKCMAKARPESVLPPVSQREINRLAAIQRLWASKFDSLYISTVTGTSEARVKEIVNELKRAANDVRDMPKGRPPKSLARNTRRKPKENAKATKNVRRIDRNQ